jgi:hypothetical protein
MREKYIYPWHQVKRVEVAIEKASQEQEAQNMVNLHGSDRAKLNDEFWQGNRQI